MTTETDGQAPADDTTLPDAADTSAEASTDAEAPSGDDAAAATDTPAPPPKKTAQERIDELTRARRDAERDAEYWRNKALQDSKPAAEPAQPAADPTKPSVESFETYEAYVEALADWKADQREAKANAERAQRDAAQAWQAKTAAAQEKHSDFDDVVMRSTWDCTRDMAQALAASEHGAEVAYHLAKNATEARRIAGLSPIAQVLEIGRLEARLSAPASPQPKTATNAPEPAPQVRGASGKFTVAADTEDFASFDKHYG